MQWEIIDNNGVVHSGTEEEMKEAFDYMILTIEEIMGTYDMNSSQAEMHQSKWKCDWDGDLKLMQLHSIHR